MFSSSLELELLFGMTMKFFWRPQFRMICAGVLPCFSARDLTTGESKALTDPSAPLPSGQ